MYIDDDDEEEEAAPPPQELEITWQLAASVWWLLVWRTAAMASVVGIIVSLAWTIFAPPNDYTPALAAAIAMPLGVAAVRMALGKTYRGFRLIAVPAEAFPGRRRVARKPQPTPAGAARARPTG